MSLPERALAAVRRSNQAYYEQITERHTLDCGIAFMCPQFPSLFDGNHLREVVVPKSQSLEQAFEQVEGIYQSHGLTCYRWVPAADQPHEPIGSLLVPRGYRVVRNLSMVLVDPTDIPVRPDVRILPARAMRKALRELRLGDTRYDDATRRMLADVENERLDDPHFDHFVALVGPEPAAMGALYQVGEIGRIEHVLVAEPFRREGVGLTLMHHLLAMSHRLAMRITVLEVSPENLAAIEFYRRCGFEPGGDYVEFVAPAALS